jgi:ribosomal protein S18 acetylase RimI-like enzyme
MTTAVDPVAVAGLDVPFLRHQVDPARVRGAWRLGAAVVLEQEPHLPGADGSVVMALGPPADVAPLAAEVAGTIAAPWRVSVEEASLSSLPGAWQPASPARWHGMLTREPAASSYDEGVAVLEIDDAAAIDAVLDEAQPSAHARPGSPGIECWLGVHDGSGLVAAGALVRMPDGTGHLRAVSVLPSARGRGLGLALSAALTRRALAGSSGVATLGVYADNAVAIGMYERLGYEVVHRFASGPPA